MAWWVTALVWAGVTLFNRIFQPKLPKPKNAEPEAFQGITVEDGRTIPVLWGTRQIKNANIGWFGDLSQTAIVQSGVTTGYKYYLGGQYPLCLGPIDEVMEVRWNEKPVGAGVTDANNELIFGANPPTYVTAEIPPGNYSGGPALAAAVEAAMKAAQAGDWKVVFGFVVEAGRTDELVWSLEQNSNPLATQVKATIQAGAYSGSELATKIQTALNNSRPGGMVALGLAFTCSHDGGTNKFTLDVPNLALFNDKWTLHTKPSEGVTYSKTALTLLGFRLNVTAYEGNFGNGFAITSEYAVIVNRFIFAYAGSTAALKLTDAGFTAATLLGLSTASDVTLLNHTAGTDFSVITASYTETADYLQVDLDDPDFFGTEGGAQGRMDIYWGKRPQAASSYLTTEFGTTAPSWPGVAHIVQRGMYVGNTNYPKPISVTPRRCPNQLGLENEHHNIGGDANPAAMIWELLTDPFWGLGDEIQESDLDKDSFVEAGDALFEEGLGLSMLIDELGPAREVIDEILRHIDGVRVFDPETSALGIRLIRNDYDAGTIPVVRGGADGNGDVRVFRRRSWGETRNVVRIRYVDRDADYAERIVELQDLANIQSRGGEMAIEEFSFPGISRRSTAEIVARRLLKAVSHPGAELELEVNRELWSLREGDPFLLTWPPLGITALPCRVVQIRTGRLSSGRIAIDGVEDLSGPVWTGFEAITEPAIDEPPPADIVPEAPASDAALVGDVPIPVA